MLLIKKYFSTQLDGSGWGSDEGRVAMAVHRSLGGGDTSVHRRTRPVGGGRIGVSEEEARQRRLVCRGVWGGVGRAVGAGVGGEGGDARVMGSARWRAAVQRRDDIIKGGAGKE
jgi:hypothetical protein